MHSGLVVGIGLLAVIILGFVWAAYRGTDTDTQPPQATSTVQDQASTTDLTEGWQQFNDDDFVDGSALAVRYPPDAELLRPQASLVTIRYVGPASDDETEITDGYIVTVEGTDGVSLAAYAAEADALGATDALVFDGKDARRYQVETELGTIATHTVFLSGTSTIIDISTSAFGSQAQSYRATIERILDSIRVQPGI